jgi:hypothetical protein
VQGTNGHKFITIDRATFFRGVRAVYSLGPPGKGPIGVQACWRQSQAVIGPSCRRLV